MAYATGQPGWMRGGGYGRGFGYPAPYRQPDPEKEKQSLQNQAAARAGRILYLADNAGEIVFDRLLVEALAPQRVTLAVRGTPVLNDATAADARAVGLTEICEVIDNGSDAPGTVLEDCSREFRQRFSTADLIIAKGQGNFETLSEAPGNIFFLFKVKCPVIATRTGLPEEAQVLACKPTKKDTARSPAGWT